MPLGPSKVIAPKSQLASVISKSVHHSMPQGIIQHHLMQSNISMKIYIRTERGMMKMLNEVEMPGGPREEGSSSTEIAGTTSVFKIVASTPIPPGEFRRNMVLAISRTDNTARSQHTQNRRRIY